MLMGYSFNTVTDCTLARYSIGISMAYINESIVTDLLDLSSSILKYISWDHIEYRVNAEKKIE